MISSGAKVVPASSPARSNAGADAGATLRRVRPFQFERDTFAFANELVWQYRFDPVNGTMTTFRTEPPPVYAHRCFVMVRTARQFLFQARFEPDRPAAHDEACRRLVREVVSRSVRRPCAESEKVVIPGCDCLRTLSQTREAILKAECGGAWQSYALRSHWRMVYPVWRRHQEGVARQLVHSFGENPAPIVHLFRFPQLTINHGLVLFDFAEDDTGVRFLTYDPNIPAHPVELTYQRADCTFYFPRTHYWPGGKLNVIEVYRGWIY